MYKCRIMMFKYELAQINYLAGADADFAGCEGWDCELFDLGESDAGVEDAEFFTSLLNVFLKKMGLR